MPKPTLQFITKEEGCSLCDEAFVEIESAMDYVDFDVDIVKIRPGDEYWDKYWDKIPVGLVDGRMIFKYRTTRDELIRKIKRRNGWAFWKK